MPPPLPLILKWSTVLIYQHCNTSPGMIWYGLFTCWKFGFVYYDVQRFMCRGFFHFFVVLYGELIPSSSQHKKKPSSLSSPSPPRPAPTNVLEINKPPRGASSMTARSNIDRMISQGSSDQNSRLGEPNRRDAKGLECRDSRGFEARCS